VRDPDLLGEFLKWAPALGLNAKDSARDLPLHVLLQTAAREVTSSDPSPSSSASSSSATAAAAATAVVEVATAPLSPLTPGSPARRGGGNDKAAEEASSSAAAVAAVQTFLRLCPGAAGAANGYGLLPLEALCASPRPPGALVELLLEAHPQAAARPLPAKQPRVGSGGGGDGRGVARAASTGAATAQAQAQAQASPARVARPLQRPQQALRSPPRSSCNHQRSPRTPGSAQPLSPATSKLSAASFLAAPPPPPPPSSSSSSSSSSLFPPPLSPHDAAPAPYHEGPSFSSLDPASIPAAFPHSKAFSLACGNPTGLGLGLLEPFLRRYTPVELLAAMPSESLGGNDQRPAAGDTGVHFSRRRPDTSGGGGGGGGGGDPAAAAAGTSGATVAGLSSSSSSFSGRGTAPPPLLVASQVPLHPSPLHLLCANPRLDLPTLAAVLAWAPCELLRPAPLHPPPPGDPDGHDDSDGRSAGGDVDAQGDASGAVVADLVRADYPVHVLCANDAALDGSLLAACVAIWPAGLMAAGASGLRPLQLLRRRCGDAQACALVLAAARSLAATASSPGAQYAAHKDESDEVEDEVDDNESLDKENGGGDSGGGYGDGDNEEDGDGHDERKGYRGARSPGKAFDLGLARARLRRAARSQAHTAALPGAQKHQQKHHRPQQRWPSSSGQLARAPPLVHLLLQAAAQVQSLERTNARHAALFAPLRGSLRLCDNPCEQLSHVRCVSAWKFMLVHNLPLAPSSP